MQLTLCSTTAFLLAAATTPFASAISVPGVSSAQAFAGGITGFFQCARALTVRSCSGNTGIKGESAGACCLNTWLTSNQTDTGKQSGLILTTQFWDGGASNETDVPTTWTVHGIWPDYCDGTYPASCTNITGIPEYSDTQIETLIKKNDPALYAEMRKYFLGVNGTYASFWQHEFNKHGTCYSTLRAECNLPQQGLSREDTVVLNYFRELMLQWRVRPTYQWLAAAGIVPDANKTYKLTDLQAALKKASGGVPYLGCPKGMNTVNEVWYYHFVQGPLIHGYYTPTDAGSFNTTCPPDVLYLPKV